MEMSKIVITDKRMEMARIGKELYIEKSSIYTPEMTDTIMATIQKQMPNATEEEKETMLYCSVYDYWIYGNNIGEEFFYRFYEKSHDEKKKYITFRNRFRYMDYLNDKKQSYILQDKYEAYKLLKSYYKRDVIRIEAEDDYDVFLDFIGKHSVFVVKPTDLGLSLGVHKECADDYPDKKALFKQILAEGVAFNEDYKYGNTSSVVLEEVLVQVEEMAKIHPYSANGVRLTTVRVGNDVHIWYPWFKIGVNGEFVTGGPRGSLLAGIDVKTGIVDTFGTTENGERFEYHPNTNIKVPGYVIPKWEELVDMMTEVAKSLPAFGYVGWDMVLTEKGWAIMEGNFAGEFLGQLMYDRGMKKEFEQLLGWKPEKEFWWE